MTDLRTEFDCATGEVTVVPLSVAEQAALDALRQQAAIEAAARLQIDAERTAASTDIRDQYAAMVAQLDQIIAAGTFANNAARDAAIVGLARGLKRTLRFVKAQTT